MMDQEFREVQEMLAKHADGLNDGYNLAARLLESRREQALELKPLFDLATGLKEVLVPIPVPPMYRLQLAEALRNDSSAEVYVGPLASRQKIFWLGLAAAGSILSLLGLLLWGRRRDRPAPASTAL